MGETQQFLWVSHEALFFFFFTTLTSTFIFFLIVHLLFQISLIIHQYNFNKIITLVQLLEYYSDIVGS